MPIDMDRRHIVVSDAQVTSSLRWHLDTPPDAVLAILDEVRARYLADLAEREKGKR